MEDCIMSFLSWLFGLGKHSRYSKHGRYSGHGGYSKHGRQHDQYEYQNHDSYSDVNQQYQNIMRCKQCNSILNKEAKFCSECGLPV